jgi:hypothetical protein
MNKLPLKKLLLPAIILAAALIMMFACSDDTTEPGNVAPDIPPLSTFSMDFSTFPAPDTLTLAKPAEAMTYFNYWWAGFNAWVWNTVVIVHAAVPVAAYAAALSQIPEQQENGSWVWSFSVEVDDTTYTCELYASTDSEGVNWQMFISQAGGFSDFLWYEGQSNLPITAGTWTLYTDPDDPAEFVDIEWHRNLTDSTADIKYTNVLEGNDGYGGYITYGTTTDTDYDAFYEVLDAASNHHIYIEWNIDTYVGHVADSLHYEDTDWHCWDGTLSDVVCE